MPITNQWYDDDKTIMLQIYDPPWTWQDYLDEAVKVYEEIGTVEHPVITIADFSLTEMLPFNSGLVKVALKGTNAHSDNWLGVVIVTNKRIVQTMAKLFQSSAKFLDYDVYLEDTFEDALNRVEEIRSKI